MNPPSLTGGRRDDSIQDSDINQGTCQLCSTSLAPMTVIERQQHYDTHFTNELASQSSRTPLRPTTSQTRWKPAKLEKPKDPFWFAGQDSAPPPNFSPGLINVLRKALTTSHSKGKTQRAFLCYRNTVHICSEGFDRFWGCGYRNFQMACTALMDQPFQPTYPHLLCDTMTPGVRNLQRTIEQAWKQGFDSDGAKQLHKLIDTRKWIGASDLWVAFSYLGLPSELVHFDCKKSPKGVQILVDWVVSYFSAPSGEEQPKDVNQALKGAEPVVCTDRMPVILQHSGHSRTVVGYELTKTGTTNLLVFDPASRPKQRLQQSTLAAAHDSYPSLSPKSSHRMKQFLRSVSPRLRGRKRTSMDTNEADANSRSDSKRRRKAGTDDTPLDEKEQSYADILKLFRVDTRNLQRHNAYQVLYFPMTAPLTEEQRSARKFVTAIEIS